MISLVLDILMYRQIQRYYIDKYLWFMNLVIDFAIFSVAIWLVIEVAKFEVTPIDLYEGFAIVIAAMTFLRVYYIILMILFPVCILPCYYMPDCCPCKRLLTGVSQKEAIWQLLEDYEWAYNSDLVKETKKPSCFLCLVEFEA